MSANWVDQLLPQRISLQRLIPRDEQETQSNLLLTVTMLIADFLDRKEWKMTCKKHTPQPTRSTSLVVLVLIAAIPVGISLGWALQTRQREPNSPQAQLQLAEHDFQTGGDQSALELFTKLANEGDPVAEYWLADMTELGLGTTKDSAKAIDLYKKAAAHGNVAADTRLGEIYLDGNIALPDFEAAKTYLKKAALQGDARAATLLGQIYRLGLGTPSDLVESFAWLEVASLENNALARNERHALLTRLSPQEQHAAVARAGAIMNAIKDKTAPPATAAAASKAAQTGTKTLAPK